MDNPNFKVLKIVSDYEIVINAGANHNIEIGDELEIFIPGEEVIDLDTNESLGTLDTIKAIIEVVTVFPKMSLCKKFEYEKSLSPLASSFAVMQGKEVKSAKRLNVDSTQISGGLSNDRKIRIGDLARKSLG